MPYSKIIIVGAIYIYLANCILAQSTNSPLQSFKAHLLKINVLSVAEHKSILATASDDNTVRLWDITDQGVSPRDNGILKNHIRVITAVQFSDDNDWLLTTDDDGMLYIWDVEDGLIVWDFSTGSQGTIDAPIKDAIFLPGEKTIAICTGAGEVIILEIPKKSSELKVLRVFSHDQKKDPDNPIAALKVRSTNNGNILLTSGEDGYVRMWHTHSGNQIRDYQHKDFITTLNVHPKDPMLFLATSESVKIKVWQPKPSGPHNSWQTLATITDHQTSITDAVFTSDGKYVISGSLEGVLSIYDIDKIKSTNKFIFEGVDYPSAIVICNSRKFIIAGTNEGRIKIWTNNSLIPPPVIKYDRKGMDIALLIAVNEYDSKNFKDLINPKKEADSLKLILERYYGFTCEVLPNPTLKDIERTISEYANKYSKGIFDPKGQFLILFSGHGIISGNPGNEQGFFLPKDADPQSINSTTLSYEVYRKVIDDIKCDHIAVIVDACYSGSFDPNQFKSGGPDGPIYNTTNPYKNYINWKCRKYITSGALEQTPDESKLMWYLREGLIIKSQNESFFTLKSLYSDEIENRAAPQPILDNFGSKRDPGGDFIFAPQHNLH